LNGETCSDDVDCLADSEDVTGYQPANAVISRWNEEFANMQQCVVARPPYSDSYLQPGVNYDKDYCYFPPRVANIKVNGSINKVLIKGTGVVFLTFNSWADAEQLPLTSIRVDWDNGNDHQMDYHPGIEPHYDSDNPHTYHTSYVYDPSNAPAQIYYPRVTIIDNWDKSSDDGGNEAGYFIPGICVVGENGTVDDCRLVDPTW
jgi:hypothetical protein